MTGRPIRVVALMEARSVTGPAKNLIEFGKRAAQPGPDSRAVELILITYARDTPDSELAAAARAAGLTTFVLVERRRWDTRTITELQRIVFECAPDILQSHNIKSHFYVRLTGLYRRFPWVVFNHGYTRLDLKDRLYTQFDRWSMRKAYRVVAVCKPFAQRLSRRGVDPSRIHVQHNSVKPFVAPTTEEVAATVQKIGIQSGEVVILSVGRLSSEKGHNDLLSAVALLARMSGLPPLRVVIVGDGPERRALEEKAEKLRLVDRIVFTGHQADVRPYYATASILVLPSHSEGSPNVVLEAMAAGIPVIATHVGGVPEIIHHEQTGLLVPARNPPIMAACVARMLRDPSIRRQIGKAGQEHVAREFTPEAYRESLVAFYEETLRSASPFAATVQTT